MALVVLVDEVSMLSTGSLRQLIWSITVYLRGRSVVTQGDMEDTQCGKEQQDDRLHDPCTFESCILYVTIELTLASVSRRSGLISR